MVHGKIPNLRPHGTLFYDFSGAGTHPLPIKRPCQRKQIYMFVFLHNKSKVIHRRCKSLYMIFQQFASPILWYLNAKDDQYHKVSGNNYLWL